MNKKLMVLTSTILFSSCGFAAGFQLNEQSITGLGRATAGGSLAGDDLSSAFYNPAEMFYINTDEKFQAGFAYISATGKFKTKSSNKALITPVGLIPVGSSSGKTNIKEETIIPHTYFVTDINDSFKFGLSIAAPFGLATRYNKNWTGRYHAIDSEVKVIDFNPSVAYKVNDKFSVGLGLSAQKISATLSQAIYTGTPKDGFAEVTGSDTSLGYNLGLAYSLNDSTRFSLSYRSKVAHTLDGKRKLKNVGAKSGKVDAKAKITLPETVSLSAFKQINDKFDVMASVRWTNWSRFDELRVSYGDGSPDSVTDESWNDSWSVSLGGDYHLSEKLTLRGGIAYDQTPIPNAKHTTPRIPDGDRVWLSAGLTYKPSKNVSVDFGYTHLFIDSGDVDNTVPIARTPNGILIDSLRGTTSADADLIGIQVKIGF